MPTNYAIKCTDASVLTAAAATTATIVASSTHSDIATAAESACEHRTRTVSIGIYHAIKAIFHYAIWSQTGPKLAADLQRARIWHII